MKTSLLNIHIIIVNKYNTDYYTAIQNGDYGVRNKHLVEHKRTSMKS
jgi:hypothetical protein